MNTRLNLERCENETLSICQKLEGFKMTYLNTVVFTDIQYPKYNEIVHVP